jgi:hypothetical protein
MNTRATGLTEVFGQRPTAEGLVATHSIPF